MARGGVDARSTEGALPRSARPSYGLESLCGSAVPTELVERDADCEAYRSGADFLLSRRRCDCESDVWGEVGVEKRGVCESEKRGVSTVVVAELEPRLVVELPRLRPPPLVNRSTTLRRAERGRLRLRSEIGRRVGNE